MKTLKIKKGDQVIVISGSSVDKGKKARVMETDPEKNTLRAEGINIQKHHKKARSAKNVGGIVTESGPIDVSNVMVVCNSCSKPTRVGYTISADGVKLRICKKCGASLDTSRAAKKAAADKKTADKKVEKKTAEKKTVEKKSKSKKTEIDE